MQIKIVSPALTHLVRYIASVFTVKVVHDLLLQACCVLGPGTAELLLAFIQCKDCCIMHGIQLMHLIQKRSRYHIRVASKKSGPKFSFNALHVLAVLKLKIQYTIQMNLQRVKRNSRTGQSKGFTGSYEHQVSLG